MNAAPRGFGIARADVDKTLKVSLNISNHQPFFEAIDQTKKNWHEFVERSVSRLHTMYRAGKIMQQTVGHASIIIGVPNLCQSTDLSDCCIVSPPSCFIWRGIGPCTSLVYFFLFFIDSFLSASSPWTCDQLWRSIIQLWLRIQVNGLTGSFPVRCQQNMYNKYISYLRWVAQNSGGWPLCMYCVLCCFFASSGALGRLLFRVMARNDVHEVVLSQYMGTSFFNKKRKITFSATRYDARLTYTAQQYMNLFLPRKLNFHVVFFTGSVPYRDNYVSYRLAWQIFPLDSPGVSCIPFATAVQ